MPSSPRHDLRAPGWRRAQGKIQPLARLRRLALAARAAGRRVVFTNGCFDLLHAGHVRVLERARALGDLLIVGINSDRSVRALRKGPNRPIVSAPHRALLLAALECVDYVTLFDEETPERAIRMLQPSVLVKGADWGSGRIVGRTLVERGGGRVVRIPLLKGLSTTALIQRIRQE